MCILRNSDVYLSQIESYIEFELYLNMNSLTLSLCLSQEVLLKRAADLVEALYGMPHNNQVSQQLHSDL